MRHSSDERDKQLMQRSAAGDRGAFDELVGLHAASILRFARAIAPNDAAAEDAMQEAFLGAWRGARSFRGETTVRSWLLTIARNAAYRQHRRRAGEPDDTDRLFDLGAAAGWGEDDPETAALHRESHELLTRAMEQLSEADREIVLLRDIEDLPGDAVAAILGLTLPAMKTRLHRARLRLATRVREAYASTR